MTPVRESTCSMCGGALLSHDDVILDDGSCYHRRCVSPDVGVPPESTEQAAKARRSASA
jgi:hypothetical protein